MSAAVAQCTYHPPPRLHSPLAGAEPARFCAMMVKLYHVSAVRPPTSAMLVGAIKVGLRSHRRTHRPNRLDTRPVPHLAQSLQARSLRCCDHEDFIRHGCAAKVEGLWPG